MSQQNVQAMRRLYEAFNAGDLETFERGLSPDILWNEAENSLYATGNPYRSFSAVRDGIFDPTARDYDNFRCELEKLLDAGDYVIGTGRYRGKNKATGKTLSAQFCHVSHVDPQGRLESIQEYVDTLQEAEVSGRTARVTEELKIPHPVM
jgi:ketosteroid isomerase-like protein